LIYPKARVLIFGPCAFFSCVQGSLTTLGGLDHKQQAGFFTNRKADSAIDMVFLSEKHDFKQPKKSDAILVRMKFLVDIMWMMYLRQSNIAINGNFRILKWRYLPYIRPI